MEATIHLTEIIKDVKSEVHLCENCAREIGLNSKLSNFSLSIPEMLSFLDIHEVEENDSAVSCPTCGLSFIDYSRENRLGCPDCYVCHEESLKSVIAGFHGSVKHTGKHPNNPQDTHTGSYIAAARILQKAKSVEELKEMLNRAIYDERYEEAAVLRDRIRKIDSQTGD
ncbi:MAG: UvrB/UvrC motif-containing protein [Spirochaetes bacterium]|nr:UvrB/UvrC motif-containing protein [Spirochaetota bacterium]